MSWEKIVTAITSLIRPRVIVGVLLLVFLWRAYHFFKPAEADATPLQRKAVEKVCAEAVRDLEVRGRPAVHLMRFGRDRGGLFRETLQRELKRSGKFRVVRASLPEELARVITGPMSRTHPLRRTQLVSRPKKLDIVGYGKIGELSEKGGEATAAFSVLRFVDLSQGRLLLNAPRNATVTKVGAEAAVGSSHGGASIWSRLLLWFLFMLLLPPLTFFAVRWAVSQDSNLASFLLIAGYTIVDTLFAFYLTGFSVSSIWVGMLLLFALGGSAFYNYVACESIARV
jgi:hypothetical protein